MKRRTRVRAKTAASAVTDLMPLGWQIVSGVAALMSFHPQLVEFADACGQSGAMDALDYFLDNPHLGTQALKVATGVSGGISNLLSRRRMKSPRLLLKWGGSGLEAAVLLLEYCPFGVPTGLLIPMDGDGFRTVLAPAEQRGAVALKAGEVLLDHGARIVLISYLEAPEAHCLDAATVFAGSPQLSATRSRKVLHTLPLSESFDATLAAMGRHTRRDLRASMRRAVKQYGAVYEPHAVVSLNEFMTLNHASMYAVPNWVARWRYESARSLDGGIFAGLRAANGAWLSLLGGQASGDRVRLDWQLNSRGFGSISMVTTMRAFFLADQVAAGMGSMRFEGGTPHSMSSAFLPESARDLLFLQNGVGHNLLRRLAMRVPAAKPLAQALTASDMVWR